MNEQLSDLEIVRRCAVAMGYSVVKADGRYKNGMAIATVDGEQVKNFDPLSDYGQCLQFVERFGLQIGSAEKSFTAVSFYAQVAGTDADLRRAICLCVSKLPAP